MVYSDLVDFFIASIKSLLSFSAIIMKCKAGIGFREVI